MGFEFENLYTPGQQILRRCIEQIGRWWRSVWQQSNELHNQQQLIRSDWLDEASRNQNRNWIRETLSGHNEQVGGRESETVFGNGEGIQTTERCNGRIHRYHLQRCQHVHSTQMSHILENMQRKHQISQYDSLLARSHYLDCLEFWWWKKSFQMNWHNLGKTLFTGPEADVWQRLHVDLGYVEDQLKSE